MKTSSFTVSLLLVAFLGGCAGGSLTATQSDFLRDSAISRIEAFNAAGLDPLQLDPLQLLALDTACFAATTIAALRSEGVEPEDMARARRIRNACSVIQVAAAKAR